MQSISRTIGFNLPNCMQLTGTYGQKAKANLDFGLWLKQKDFGCCIVMRPCSNRSPFNDALQWQK